MDEREKDIRNIIERDMKNFENASTEQTPQPESDRKPAGKNNHKVVTFDGEEQVLKREEYDIKAKKFMIPMGMIVASVFVLVCVFAVVVRLQSFQKAHSDSENAAQETTIVRKTREEVERIAEEHIESFEPTDSIYYNQALLHVNKEKPIQYMNFYVDEKEIIYYKVYYGDPSEGIGTLIVREYWYVDDITGEVVKLGVQNVITTARDEFLYVGDKNFVVAFSALESEEDAGNICYVGEFSTEQSSAGGDYVTLDIDDAKSEAVAKLMQGKDWEQVTFKTKP